MSAGSFHPLLTDCWSRICVPGFQLRTLVRSYVRLGLGIELLDWEDCDVQGKESNQNSTKKLSTHPTSQKQGDIVFASDGHIQITNAVAQHQHSDFIIDVEVCSMVTGDGIGRPYGMLKWLCLRTIPLHRQRMKIPWVWEQLCRCQSCLFSFCSWLFWLYWLPGCKISVHFGFSGT